MKKRIRKKRWKTWLNYLKKNCDFCQKTIEYARFCERYFSSPKFRQQAEEFSITPQFVFQNFIQQF